MTQLVTITFNATTTSTPEQFVASLTDFGPGRAQLFPNSADEYLKVLGAHEADVTEGSNGTCKRLHYDWSDPNNVVMRTISQTRGAAARVTPIRSGVIPTAEPPWTRSSCARGRT